MGTVKALDHVNIVTADMAATTAFFAEVLELTPGPAAPGLPLSMVTWLHDARGHPVVHLGASDGVQRGATGALDHVAFECADEAAVTARLDARGDAYECREFAAARLRQIFVTEPNGVRLELNFRNP